MESNPMDEKEKSRLEAFSDGVFAVAITLLVLNIKVPGLDLPPGQWLEEGKLWIAVRDEWPTLVAYIISFLTIGIMWLNHHRLFVHIKRIDTILLFINLLLLMTIVFIPVPTALLAQYIVLPGQHAAAIIYSGTCLLMACCFNGLWRYASYHHRLLGKNVDAEAVEAINRPYFFWALLFLIFFFAALIHPPLGSHLLFF